MVDLAHIVLSVHRFERVPWKSLMQQVQQYNLLKNLLGVPELEQRQ